MPNYKATLCKNARFSSKRFINSKSKAKSIFIMQTMMVNNFTESFFVFLHTSVRVWLSKWTKRARKCRHVCRN